MTKKILFTGYYGFDNFGDDLFGLACVGGLKILDGDYSPVILSPPIRGVKAKYLVPRILGPLYKSRGFFGKSLRALFMIYGCIMYADVVSAGGSVVSSGSSFRIRYIQYHMARLGFCRLSAIGVSVGPFFSKKDRESAKRFISQLSYLAVRDEASISECHNMEVAVEAHLYNDLAGCASLPVSDKEKNKTLGVSVCRYESITGGNAENENLRNIAIFHGVADFAVKYNFKVNIFILNANEDLGDVDISKQLYDYLLERGVSSELIGYFGPAETLKSIAMCDIFFSVRLHGAIAAYLLDVPFLLVEYHSKCKDFLDYIGFDNESRVLADITDGGYVSECLEAILQGEIQYAMQPPEYIENANKIFMKSPWAKQSLNIS